MPLLHIFFGGLGLFTPLTLQDKQILTLMCPSTSFLFSHVIRCKRYHRRRAPNFNKNCHFCFLFISISKILLLQRYTRPWYQTKALIMSYLNIWLPYLLILWRNAQLFLCKGQICKNNQTCTPFSPQIRFFEALLCHRYTRPQYQMKALTILLNSCQFY